MGSNTKTGGSGKAKFTLATRLLLTLAVTKPVPVRLVATPDTSTRTPVIVKGLDSDSPADGKLIGLNVKISVRPQFWVSGQNKPTPLTKIGLRLPLKTAVNCPLGRLRPRRPSEAAAFMVSPIPDWNVDKSDKGFEIEPPKEPKLI
jgi:hypothetical protein